jgi:DNA repair protein RecO (recombination protein O)
MSLYKTKGIVIKTHKLGEADRIITIITGTHGKVRAVAKGVRKTKSKFGSRLEPFTHVELLLYKGRNLDIVTQAEIVDSFADIREDFDRLHYGSAMLDLAEKVSSEGERDMPLYNLLLRSLEVLSSTRKNMRLLLVAFDAKLMAVSGYMPKLERCAMCEAIPGAKVHFSFQWGGVACDKCACLDRGSVAVMPAAVDLLQRLIRLPLADVAETDVLARIEDESHVLMRDYVNYYIQAKLKSRDALRLIYV